MLVGIAYDLRDHYRSLGFSEEDVAEFDSVSTIDAIDNALKELGFETERIGAITKLVDQLAGGKRWDLVFNIAEGVYGIGREAQVPAICDAYKIPYTFSDPCVLGLTLNKELAKRVVRDLGLATPEFKLVHSVEELENLQIEYPLFAKPYSEGTGKGINASSVIKDKNSLKKVCSGLLTKYKQPVLIESYLSGREFTVGILGSGKDARVIGTIEVILKDQAEEGVYSYVNKENCEDFVLYKLVNDDTSQMAGELALAAWTGIGCLDAGRVDVRCDSLGIPNFIEVNPLAGLNPEHSDLPIICIKTGISYLDLIGSILNSSLRRYSILNRAPDKIKQISVPEKLIKKHNSNAKSSENKKVVILHQQVPGNASEDEKDVLVESAEIAEYISSLGYEPIRLGVTLDFECVKKKLMRINPLKVFNLVESVAGYDWLASFMPALLNSLNITYTGSCTEAISITGNKLIAKRLMGQAGIPTPPYLTLPVINIKNIVKGDYIVKSIFDHASIGIDENSVMSISGSDDLIKLDKIAKRYRSESFAELFVHGREFNISILDGPAGPEILPAAEIVFNGYPDGKPKIVDYRAKWDQESYEYRNTQRRYDFKDNELALLKSLENYAAKCWDLFSLRGYGRIDFRVDNEENPWVLEVNTNPCLSSDAGFMAAAEKKGIPRDEVIKRIMSIH